MTAMSEVALRGSVVLLIGLIGYAALRGQAPALRHALLVATLCATPLAAPLGAVLPAIAVTLPRPFVTTPSMPPMSEHVALVGAPVMAAPAPLGAATPAEPARLSWGTLLFARRGLGTAIALGALALSLVRLARATRTAAPIGQPQWDEALARASRAAGLRRPGATRKSKRRPARDMGLAARLPARCLARRSN